MANSTILFSIDALMEHTGGVMQVTGVNATANIWASYPAKHISVLGGFVDQVRDAPSMVI
jgi:hypothetical protein